MASEYRAGGRRLKTSPAKPACRWPPPIASSTSARACAGKPSPASNSRSPSSAIGPMPPPCGSPATRAYRFAFILPSNANSFMSNLSVQVERASDWLAGQNGYIDVMHVDVFDPNALATALERLVAGLSRRCHRGARSHQGPGRDRRPRRARRSCRDAGIGRAVLPAGALCRRRQSRRRPHRRLADGTLSAGCEKARSA